MSQKGSMDENKNKMINTCSESNLILKKGLLNEDAGIQISGEDAGLKCAKNRGMP